MAEYVTQSECETRRQCILEEEKEISNRIANLETCLQVQTVELKHLVAQNKWFTGIISTIVSGIGLWLITGGN